MCSRAQTAGPVAARRWATIGVVALVAGLGAVGAAEPAGAAVTSFTMSPAAGSPGTVVHVRGSGCAPGVLGSRNANFVTVTATTLDVAFRVPVAANGRWSGVFTVPAGAVGSAPVTAACVSSNVISLTTLYTPRVFRVTATSVTTRPEPPTTGDPVPGPVHLPGDPTTTVGVPSAPGNEHPTAAPSRTAAPSGSGSDATTSTKPRAAHVPGARPATLQPAGVDTRSAAGTGAGLGWLGWMLVLLLVLATLGASGYFWKARHPRDAMPEAAA